MTFWCLKQLNHVLYNIFPYKFSVKFYIITNLYINCRKTILASSLDHLRWSRNIYIIYSYILTIYRHFCRWQKVYIYIYIIYIYYIYIIYIYIIYIYIIYIFYIYIYIYNIYIYIRKLQNTVYEWYIKNTLNH